MLLVPAMAQLNRSVEKREGDEGKRPQLSDLRESGAIEQDADIVCFIHRPEYYKIYNDEQGRNMRGMAEFIIAKHRNGAVDTVLMRFRNEYARFQDTDEDDYIPMPGETKSMDSALNTSGSGTSSSNAPSLSSNEPDAPLPPLPPATDNDSPFGPPTPMNDVPF